MNFGVSILSSRVDSCSTEKLRHTWSSVLYMRTKSRRSRTRRLGGFPRDIGYEYFFDPVYYIPLREPYHARDLKEE